MGEVTRSITIHRPPAAVFTFLSNPENDPTWVSASIEHHRTSKGPKGLGSTSREMVRAPWGGRLWVEWRVSGWERDSLISYEATSQRRLGSTELDLMLKEVPAGTRVVLRCRFAARGPLRLLEPLFLGHLARTWSRRDLPALKQQLEESPRPVASR
ncbi:MAG: hypothetical protein E6J02_08720 [Chloroflexi bacterium]|nr:MAG: hypothetical protein E6J02_08720 [Chloroflexota bacterium]TME16428.1 MAG: hypothetical protein E6I63_06320 [Chloroflexota bacterium]TME17585.1 MAG: hypothetical protein E6I70_10040 [Chloroflexota bacterium]